MRTLLRQALVENALLKGIALGIAVALFLVVHADKDALSGVYVKVVYLAPADRVLVSDPPSEIRVTVRGPYTRVSRLAEHDLEPMRVDLSGQSDGDLRFGEDMIRLPPGLHLATISPPSARLRFDARVERSVPVQPMLEGLPAAGYRVVRSTASPKTVRVSGARSVVDGIARVQTLPLRIAEAREPVRGQVGLAPAPPHAEWRSEEPYTVEAEVEPTLVERTLRDVPVRVEGASRLEAHADPATVQVVLRGPAEAVGTFAAAGLLRIAVDAQVEDGRTPGTWHKRPSIGGLPGGITAELRPDSVMLVTRRRKD
jgi:YbbR domain-containing protein